MHIHMIIYIYNMIYIYIHIIYYIYNVSYKRLYMYIYALNKTYIYIYIHYNIEANVYMYHENMFAHLQVIMFDLFAISVLAFLRSASLSLHYYVHIYIYLTPLEMHMHSLAYVIWLNALWICLPGRTIFLSPGSYWMAFRDLLQGYFRCCLRHLKSRISIRSSDTRFTSNN